MTVGMQQYVDYSAKFATTRRGDDVADPTLVKITRPSYLVLERHSIGQLCTAYAKAAAAFRNTWYSTAAYFDWAMKQAFHTVTMTLFPT